MFVAPPYDPHLVLGSVLTRGGHFTDLDGLVAPLALLNHALPQHPQHKLLRELGQDLQFVHRNIKLGPVIGENTLTGVTHTGGRERRREE